MRTDHSVTRPSSERIATRPIVDGETSVKPLPSLAVGNYNYKGFAALSIKDKNQFHRLK